MTDIPLLERLRLGHTTSGMKMLGEAADTIEAQEAQIHFWKDRMREALKTIKENVDRIAELEEINKRQKFAINELRLVNAFEDVDWKTKGARIAELEKELDKHRQALVFIQMKAQDILRPIPFQDEDE